MKANQLPIPQPQATTFAETGLLAVFLLGCAVISFILFLLPLLILGPGFILVVCGGWIYALTESHKQCRDHNKSNFQKA